MLWVLKAIFLKHGVPIEFKNVFLAPFPSFWYLKCNAAQRSEVEIGRKCAVMILGVQMKSSHEKWISVIIVPVEQPS